MNPVNSINNIIKKVFAAELYALADDISGHFGLDKEVVRETFVSKRLDMYNIRRRGGGGGHHRKKAEQNQQQTAVVHAREIMHHGKKYLMDVNTGFVYTDDMSNPVHVGEVLINGDVLLYSLSSSSSSAPDEHRHQKNDEDCHEDEQDDEETDKAIKIHLHL